MTLTRKDLTRSSGAFRCVVGLAAAACAIGARWVLDPVLGQDRPFLTIYGAVALAVWFGRWQGAVVATLIGHLAVRHLFVLPRGTVAFDLSVATQVAWDLLSCALIITVGELMHRARDRAERAAAEQRRAEEALRASEERERGRATELQALLEAVPAIIWTARDPECEVITGNSAADALLRLPPRENASKSAPKSERLSHFDVLCDGRLLGPNDLPVQRAARGEEVRDFEEEVRFADGTSRFLFGNATPLRDARQQPSGAVAAFIDITARKRAEREVRRLAAIVEATPDFVGVARLDGRVVYINRAGRQMLGLEETGDLREINHRALVPDWVHDRTQKEWMPAALQSGSAAGEGALLTASGVEIPVSFVLLVHRAAGGEPEFVSTIARDISESRQNERRLRFLAEITERIRSLDDAQALLRAVAEAVGRHLALSRCGLVELDIDSGRWTVAPQFRAPGLKSIEGSHSIPAFDGGIGAKLAAGGLVAVSDAKTDPLTADRYHTGFGPQNTEAFVCVPLRRKGRLAAVFGATCAQPRVWTGDEVGLLETVAERTWSALERLRVEAALHEAHQELANRAGQLEKLVEQRTARLQETIGELEVFSYSIAHDMRAPLRAMSGMSSLLEQEHRDRLDAAGLDYLRRINSAARRLDELICDVLSYSQVVRSEVELDRIELDVLVPEILQEYPQFSAKGAQVKVERPLAAVIGNRALLSQCIANLAGNAAKFVRPERQPQIRIWTEDREDRVRLSVADNGIGIAAEHLPKIWRMFERLETRYEGTGIGLAIVKKAAERMRGRVGVESEPGRGSTFWLELTRPE